MPNAETGHEMLGILEIRCSKFRISETNLEKTTVLAISVKYLSIYRINHSFKKSPAKKLK